MSDVHTESLVDFIATQVLEPFKGVKKVPAQAHWKKRPVATAVLVFCIVLMIGLIIWGKFTTMTHSM